MAFTDFGEALGSGGLVVKNPPPMQETQVQSPGGGNSNPLQYSCLGNHLSLRGVGHNLVTKQQPPPLACENNNTTKKQQRLLKKKSTGNNIYLNCLIGFLQGSQWDNKCTCILKSTECNS